MTKKRILFSPLNWGLGHAVRSVSLLKELSAQGFEIILAGEGISLEYLKKEFPAWKSVGLPSFQMQYSSGNSQIIPVLKSLPQIISASCKEHRLLNHLIREHHIDIVISDNRFGLFSKNCISVYITHQLTIPMPAGFRFMQPLVSRMHRAVISRYTHCWIPDEEGEPNLAGRLSHPHRKLPHNARYIGILSRFLEDTLLPMAEKKYDFLFLLSGVEPQRTLLEKKITSFYQRSTGYKAALVRGVSSAADTLESTGELTVYNQLPGDGIRELLSASGVVVCRSGYTSIMELASISQRAVFIPTPGQPEQVYLADYLSSCPLFTCIRQEEFTLDALLKAASETREYPLHFTSGKLVEAVKSLS